MINEAWPVGAYCDTRGSTGPLPSGSVVVTCPETKSVYEFAPGNPQAVWSLTWECTATDLMAEVLPVSW